MSCRPIVCYLITGFDEITTFNNFINNYNKFSSGINHKLVICFKLFSENNLKIIQQNLKDIDYEAFIDPEIKNDFDLGSYKRVAEKFAENEILFLNSHSYPICNDWLKKLMIHKNDDNIIATSGSFESLVDSIKLKKIYKIFSYLIKKIKYKKKFDHFPNPHIRTTGFLIKGKLFLEFILKKEINNKLDAWMLESGKNNFTNFFKNKGYDLFIVNSNGEKFAQNEWYLSETYNYMNQSKSIISDKHTRKYLKLTEFEKKTFQNKTWGL